jgi:phosphatidylglycerol:prolipoprotein diacylglycerol transferase
VLSSISYPPIPALEAGPFALSLHGIMTAAGFAAGAAVMVRTARRRGFDEAGILSMLAWGLVGALVGARLLTVPAHLGDPGFGVGVVVGPSGHFSIMGGFAGGIAAALIRGRMLGTALLPHLDMAAFGLALGTVVGRIGDLFIVEHLGGHTTFFLGYVARPGYDLAPQHDALERACSVAGECGPYHHAALYDLLGAAVLLGVLVWASRRRLRYGMLFGVWAAWYGLQRFAIDFTRNTDLPGSDAALGPLTWNQWSGLLAGVVAAGAVLWIAARRITPAASRDADHRLAGRPERRVSASV